MISSSLGIRMPVGWFDRRATKLHTCDLTMNESPDFRSEKMDSTEGRGIALGRWSAFWIRSPTMSWQTPTGTIPSGRLPTTTTSCAMTSPRRWLDDSELIGFWVAWHQAGGLCPYLESVGGTGPPLPQGPKKFRTRYGAHPDE